MKALSDEVLIRRYIRQHGVTKCPTVALAPTTATIPHDDRIAAYVRDRDDAIRESMARHRNGKQQLKARQSTSLRARNKKD